jgi:anaerobic magnesium-protoporphyrin IX monomethyl ester cyclase
MVLPEKRLDVVFVEPDSSQKAYQELSKDFSAIETPTWSLLLAQSCRAKGFGVAILDCKAEFLTDEMAIERVREMNPRLVCVVLYGQNPNSGTTNMIGGIRWSSKLKESYPEYLTCFVGSHVSALPKEVLVCNCVDIVLLNEGVYALHNLLRSDLYSEFSKICGIGYKDAAGQLIINSPQGVVPQGRLAEDLPGYAWDLLPYDKKPLDLYRAHFWHAEFSHDRRTPFAALYTSLGCSFKCDFCMINILNRTDHSDGIVSTDSNIMRYWPPEFMLQEFDKLAKMGVETVRLSDEMFFLNRKYYEPLLNGLIDRDYDLRMWSYSRVDTVRPDSLEMFKKAGINWFCLGIEAANQEVRREITKGSFKNINIRDVVKEVEDSGIDIISNFIFGFPDDTLETMQETLDLALEINTAMTNMYPCQALPGSKLYNVCIENGWSLPDSYEGFAFLSYDCQPMPTKYVSAAEVLKFRDEAWQTYFSSPRYLDRIENQFGPVERKNVEAMASIRLQRKLLGDSPPEVRH